MKKTFARILIACLLMAALGLAISRSSQSFYPSVEIEARYPAGAVTLSFLLESRATMSECETVAGSIARNTMKHCPHCSTTKLSCEPSITPSEQLLLSVSPIGSPSRRLADGVVTFKASKPEHALAICQSPEVSSSEGGYQTNCYPPNTERNKLPSSSQLSVWSLVLPLAAFVSTCLVCWLIIRYEHLHAHLSHDHVDSGPQKYHMLPTPRIGGLAIMFGLISAGSVMLIADTVTSERAFGLLMVAGIPAFLGGLVEDISKKVGVMERLLLTMLSGALAAWLLGAVLDHLDIPGIDQALAWLAFAVVFTTFAVGGLANAINIIDGYNGLASGFSVIILAAMAFVANSVGDNLVFVTSLSLVGAILGFLVWNWPGGKIFFGDGGAYLVGFILAELSILLVVRNPGVSPWFPLLLLIYPIFETFYTIYRRKFQNNLSPGQPDNQHLHQLIHDNIILNDAGQEQGEYLNSRVAKYLWVPAAVLALTGSVFWASTPILAACAVGFCVFYVVSYRQISRISYKGSSTVTLAAK